MKHLSGVALPGDLSARLAFLRNGVPNPGRPLLTAFVRFCITVTSISLFVSCEDSSSKTVDDGSTTSDSWDLAVDSNDQGGDLGNPTLDRAPWPMYCHDPQHTCRSPFTGLTEQPKEPSLFYRSPGGMSGFTSSISIGSDGRVYVGSAHNEDFVSDKSEGYSGVLCVVSPGADEKTVWLHDSHRGSPMISMIESGPLLTSDGRVIYGKDDGHVYALSQDGTLLWDFSTDDPFNPDSHDDNEQIIPSPVLGADGTLYVLSHWGNVYSPQVIASWNSNPALKSIIDKYKIGPSNEQAWGRLYAVDVDTGKRKWVFDPSRDPSNKQTFWGSPAMDPQGTLYAAAYDSRYNGYLYALSPDGTLQWKHPEDGAAKIQALQSSPAIGEDGTIYVGSYAPKEKARLYAFNSNGTLKWSYPISENRITSGPAIGPNGALYFGSHNHPTGPYIGALYNVADSGTKAELRWRFETPAGIIASPAVDQQGNVYFRSTVIQSADGEQQDSLYLYALNIKGEKLWSYPFTGRSWGAPSIGKDGTIYVNVMGRTEADKAGLYAFGPAQN